MKLLTLFVITLFVAFANCLDINKNGEVKLDSPISEISDDTTTKAPTTTSLSPNNTTVPTTVTTTVPSTVPTTTSAPNTPTTSAPTTTPVPTTTPTTSTTEAPKPPPKCPQFSFLSFIGGIIMTVGLAFIGGLVFKFYKARTERNYHTL